MMRNNSMTSAAILFSSFLASGAVAQTPAPAQAPAANGQQPAAQNLVTKTQQFGDWVLTCRKVDVTAQAAHNCELTQTVTINGQQAPFAQMAIGKPKADMPIQITVVVPQNVSFPSSVRVLVDEKDKSPTDLTWARCLPVGCFANASLKDDTQKKWGALETQGRVIFKAGNGQDIAMPISFKGLKGALEALAKEK